MNKRLNPLETWFDQRGWQPFAFQRETWQAYLDGHSGLVHAPTGVGKTYAVWGGPLLEALDSPQAQGKRAASSLRVLWLTPLRALASDTVSALERPLADLGLPWRVEKRTGDSSSAERRRQRKQLPTVLVTTPESLSLLFTYSDARQRLSNIHCVIVDEWHELLGSKRGVQTELCLARLRQWNPRMRTWGLSATLGNLDQAMQVLLGSGAPAGHLVSGDIQKEVAIETVLPGNLTRFPWAGHLGLNLMPEVIERLQQARSTLLFTNTRSQAELWYHALLDAVPDWSGEIALHHGSIERAARTFVEEQVAAGQLRCVVATSSLDLGVDFSPVDQVIQVGSPKGVARLLQRAGRSGHQPGQVSRVLGVPTHAFELVEFAAARDAIQRCEIEARTPLTLALDVLVQHLVSAAMGTPFQPEEMLAEIQTTHAFAHLSEQDWQWSLDFIRRGGPALQAYPHYARVTEDEDGRLSVTSRQIARWHRLSIGTIASDQAIVVRYVNGPSLGSVEESFIAKLKKGDQFLFAGKLLQLVQVRDMKAWVRKAKGSKAQAPRWMGGSMPLSSELAAAVVRQLEQGKNGDASSPEMQAVQAILQIQQRWSQLPQEEVILLERTRSREGSHVFVFPFAGRLVHEGLAALCAYRLSQRMPCSISIMATDYGFELLSTAEPPWHEAFWREIFSPQHIVDDILQSMNAAELAKRQFRGIARVAGLVFSGYPGQMKTARQLQASSSLIYEVFDRYDPENRLLKQAQTEVLEAQLEVGRLRSVLQRIEGSRLALIETERLTPLAFPIWAERIRAHVSSESWQDRVQRMSVRLEKAAEPKKPKRRNAQATA